MDIAEGNRLIAEFLWGKQGNPEDREPEWYMGMDLPWCDEDGYYTGVGAMLPVTIDNLSFHSSWDWLMPVIKKIRTVLNTELSVDEYDAWRYLQRCLNPFDYDINYIYAKVVVFLEWYNTKKQ